ncbi:hypothetical protein CFP56_011692 [Quercus suber]|uniref:Uncharacterized protein n=1 Tax=Quercus suber TaxID=58331 RepID=A0AAW0KWL2_QUESU
MYIPVDDVLQPIDPKQMIKGCECKVSPHFPENYKTCVNFYRLLEKMARDGSIFQTLREIQDGIKAGNDWMIDGKNLIGMNLINDHDANQRINVSRNRKLLLQQPLVTPL